MKRQPPTSAPYAIASLPIMMSRSPSTPVVKPYPVGVAVVLGDVVLAGLDRADVQVDDLLALALVDAVDFVAHDLQDPCRSACPSTPSEIVLRTISSPSSSLAILPSGTS